MQFVERRPRSLCFYDAGIDSEYANRPALVSFLELFEMECLEYIKERNLAEWSKCKRMSEGESMTNDQSSRIERRAGQRFNHQASVTLRSLDGATGAGFTLDLSSRGALLLTDFPLIENQIVEMTLMMPSEITLTENMSVRCRARVLRLDRDRDSSKSAVAVKIEHYEYLPNREMPVVRHAISGAAHLARP